MAYCIDCGHGRVERIGKSHRYRRVCKLGMGSMRGYHECEKFEDIRVFIM